MRTLLALLLIGLPTAATIASDDDDAAAALALASLQREKKVKAHTATGVISTPVVETPKTLSYHLEVGPNGQYYTVPDGYTLQHNLNNTQKGVSTHPFPSTTQDTSAPPAGGVSLSSQDTTLTGRTTISVRGMVRSGGTNCVIGTA